MFREIFQNSADISIHAPSRERPAYSNQLSSQSAISIHAPSRERLRLMPVAVLATQNFNPRSLTGATAAIYGSMKPLAFQSTLPHGSDAKAAIIDTKRLISIHAPSRERPHQNKILLHSFKSSIYCELAQFKSLKILF